MTITAESTAQADQFPAIVVEGLEKLGNIATLPAVAVRLMQLVEDPRSTVVDIEQVITTDPALCARILRVANSSFYGFSRRIGSIDHAITMLGLNAIKNIAVATSLHKVFLTKQSSPGLDAQDLWTHSVAVATAAREFANKSGPGIADEAFLAGLIHDIGVMVEMQAYRTRFNTMLEALAVDADLTFRQAERDVFGATHEQFGAALCRGWKFPLHLEAAVASHHEPPTTSEPHAKIAVAVHAADVMAARCGTGYARTVETETLAPELTALLGLHDADVESIEAGLPEAVAEARHILTGA